MKIATLIAALICTYISGFIFAVQLFDIFVEGLNTILILANSFFIVSAIYFTIYFLKRKA